MAGPPPHHLTWKTTTVDGRRASYGEAGTGTPFLFLHGWGLRDRTYRRALSRVARLGVRVIAPSLPGFGETAALPGDQFSLDGYADWVAEFARSVGIDGDYYLGGHSFGGGVAIKTAHAHGDGCRLLVLVNSIGGAVWKGADGNARYLADRPLWDWGLHFNSDMARGKVLRNIVPVVLADAARNVVRDPLAFIRVGGLARRANLLRELEELTARELPIAVLWGREDTILPAASLDAIVKAVGHGADVVPGRHVWLLDDPDRFGEMMTNVIGMAEAARDPDAIIEQVRADEALGVATLAEAVPHVPGDASPAAPVATGRTSRRPLTAG